MGFALPAAGLDSLFRAERVTEDLVCTGNRQRVPRRSGNTGQWQGCDLEAPWAPESWDSTDGATIVVCYKTGHPLHSPHFS